MALTLYNHTTKEMETSYEGCVLRTFSKVVQIMSDEWDTMTYAEVWDAVNTRVTSVGVGWTYAETKSIVEIDATPEVLAAVKQWKYNLSVADLIEKATIKAETPAKNKMVEVVSGRGVKVGTKGLAVVEIERPYKMGWQSVMMKKFGIAVSDDMVEVEVKGKTYLNHKDIAWVWARNLKVVEPDPIDMTSITDRAEEIAAQYVKSFA